MSSATPRVVVAGMGLIVIDEMMILDGHPEPDTKVMAVTANTQIGGPVPTALAQLRRWNYECRFSGRWGDDPEGIVVARELTVDGIDQFRRGCAETGTPRAQIWIDRHTGRRTTVAWNPPVSRGDDGLPDGFLDGVHWLHLDGRQGETANAAARCVREAGGRVSLDAGTVKPGLEELFPLCDVVQLPLQTATSVTGLSTPSSAARKLSTSGPSWVAVTDGANGAWLAAAGGVVHQPAFPVSAVDTNGAGDVFAAGLIHGFLTQKSPATALRFAAAAAAYKCQGHGNRDALGSIAAISEFLTAP